MNRLLMVLLVACFAPSAVLGAGVDSTSLVAQWEGGGITVGEYTRWWSRLPPTERPVLSTMDARTAFLDNVINARLMLDEAKALGLDKSLTVVEWMQTQKANTLKEHLYQQAVEGRINVTEEDVDRIVDRRRTQITAKHIVVSTLERANEMLDSLNSGVTFEDLASRYSTCPSGANQGYLGVVRWGDFSDRWSSEAFQLEPGEISQPFPVENGYCIVKVETKTMTDLTNPEQQRARVRAGLERDINLEERKAFLDSLGIAYEVNMDVAAVVDLCAGYAEALQDLGETREVVDADVEPYLTSSEKERPVVTFRGGSFSYGDVVNMILDKPYVVRPQLDDPDEMIAFINRQLNDTLLIREAYHRGIDRLPEVAIPMEKLEQKRILMRFYHFTTSQVEIPEDSLRQHFEAHPEKYMTEAGHTASKIVLKTKAAADSILQLIRQGQSFEDLAIQNSIDPFTAPLGGDMGFYPEGKDTEFDGFFATMQVGDISYFRSVEGHVILWLRQRHEKRVPTFEEARESVETDIRPAYKDAMLARWLTERRRQLGVRINQPVLEGLELSS
jgi:peptidyl-prolyl cis-trans isomerase C